TDGAASDRRILLALIEAKWIARSPLATAGFFVANSSAGNLPAANWDRPMKSIAVPLLLLAGLLPAHAGDVSQDINALLHARAQALADATSNGQAGVWADLL